MTGENNSREPKASPFNIRPDVVRMLRDRPFATFDEVYDHLQEVDAQDVISILEDSFRYSHEDDKRTAFVSGILHVLRIQLISQEFDKIEASMNQALFNDDDGVEGRRRSDVPDDDQPIA